MWNISHASRTLLRTAMLALCFVPMHGQTANTGAIAGAVSDPSEALVPHAAVVINSQATGEKRDLATDGEGSFSVQFLMLGTYDITVRGAGLEPVSLKGVQVQTTEVSRVKIATLQSGLPFGILDSAAGTLFGLATLYTTGSVAQCVTLADAGQSGSVSRRVYESFNTRAVAAGPFAPEGGLTDGKYPVSGGGAIFGTLGRKILRGPDRRDFDIAVIKTTPLTERVKLSFRCGQVRPRGCGFRAVLKS
jgi:hypothetical protein